VSAEYFKRRSLKWQLFQAVEQFHLQTFKMRLLSNVLTVAALTLITSVIAADPPLPNSGDNGDMGGIFGIGASIITSGMPPGMATGLTTPGSESPRGAAIGPTTTGSGPYEAHYVEDPTLPNHTIFAPKTPPQGLKMPAFIFGNGGCTNVGTMFESLLLEIASHGYLAIANGPPRNRGPKQPAGTMPVFNPKDMGSLLGSMGSIGMSKVKQMLDAVDWVVNGSANKYGDIDTEKIVASGQSCGGLEAYSTSYHNPKVKLTMIFNVGVFDESRRHFMSELQAPVGWFMGGPHDAGYLLVRCFEAIEYITNIEDRLKKTTNFCQKGFRLCLPAWTLDMEEHTALLTLESLARLLWPSWSGSSEAMLQQRKCLWTLHLTAALSNKIGMSLIRTFKENAITR
jgi:dienelactone hydrolase